jgi:hypothetical protein
MSTFSRDNYDNLTNLSILEILYKYFATNTKLKESLITSHTELNC